MPVSFNRDLVDSLVAPGLSTFTTFNAPDLTAAYPEATHWLTNHFLNNILGPRFKDKYRQWAMNQLFRAEVVFRDYHEARAFTADVLAKGSPSQPAIRTYFNAIARWESCLLNIQIFIDLLNKMKGDLGDAPVFAEGDGSRDQRAYSMANTIKHWGSDVACGRHEQHHTIPIWLSNDELRTRTHSLSASDLAVIVAEIAAAADSLQDPKSFASAR